MKKERFLSFVKDNILSMFTGSDIIGEEESSPRDACVAQGTGGSLLVKFNRNDSYRFVIKRVQPFKTFEISLVKSIIEEVSTIYNNKVSDDFIKGLEGLIIEKAICKALTKSASSTLSTLITSINQWGLRTYEGKKISFGFILTNKLSGKLTNPNLHITKMLNRDFSALISDGENTCMEISRDGYLTSYIALPRNENQGLLAPYSHLRIANLCNGSKIGISLIAGGDILIFKDKNLLFAKRNGKWVSFSHDEIIGKLSDRSDEVEEVRRAIYLSALDLSFSKDGGCIVHVNSGDKFNVLKHINATDVLFKDCYDYIEQENINQSFFRVVDEWDSEIPSYDQFVTQEKCIKTANLIKIINGRKFQDLDRKLRLELLGIDGATIIDYEGNILAVGAIIKIEAGSLGGGRLAAAKTLSNYGISIKVSADGSIEGFRMDRNKLRAKPIFMIG
ncbi:MAG: hypothetical protein IJW24_03285 [Clostridia bacterium]|nr:hypothetical protein [Clostridia bacterium]